VHLTRADLAAVDLRPLEPLAADRAEFTGRGEHYRLLAHLSARVDRSKPVVDVGTHRGDSALALSYGGALVRSFDVVDKTQGRPRPANVVYHLDDLFDPVRRDYWRQTLLDSSIVFIDVDPHEGTREYALVRYLQESGYRGIIVLDDVWYFKPMRDKLWYRIEPRFRSDATALGHWSGTGLVSFGDRVTVDGEADTSNWTLVTGYFDLTGRSDASPELRARPATHYLDQHAPSTLSLDQNLVVYCEPANEEKVWSMRPKWLHDRTRVVVQSFDDFPLTRYQPQIVANRGGPWCGADPRNTASYYLFCMARYAMLKQAIAADPFKSTHFAWINVCIERMGYQNLVHLREALGVQRDRFSICFIDYVPKPLVEDLPRYFGPQGCRTCVASCSMCSGFFTGGAWYMREFCDRVEREFLRCLDAGYGHADEQLYPLVYFADPGLFEWYPGDYTEMVTNYAHVYERAEQPVRNLIRNSLAAGDHAVCGRACDMVLDSLEAGTCALSPADYDLLIRAKRACS
jgi:hypothetical protein